MNGWEGWVRLQEERRRVGWAGRPTKRGMGIGRGLRRERGGRMGWKLEIR
jgi:hypothetical protein